MKTKISENLEK